ncbi:hypothetical protein HPG69_002116, partial [Diceros bicornis minor]
MSTNILLSEIIDGDAETLSSICCSEKGPQFVIRGFKTNETNEVVSLFIPADRKSSTLSLPQVALRDSAVYYC